MNMMNTVPLYRDLLCYVFLILYFLYAINTIRAFQLRNWKHFGIYGFLFAIAYVMHLILNSVIKVKIMLTEDRFTMKAGAISVVYYGMTALILFILWLISFSRFLKWKQNHVSTTSVKESLDNLPSGIVIFQEDGNCVLTNHRMNRLGELLTGHTVMDGNEILRAAEECNMTVEQDGKKYVFHHWILEHEGISLHELIADDMTELYEKTEELSEGNRQLKEFAGKMKQYGLTIDESTKKQEILNIKIRIHDEMNSLLLATEHALSDRTTEEEIEKIFFAWKNNALLLSMEASEISRNHAIEDMETLASMIGIELVWNGTLTTDNSSIQKLFEQITREAMANAVKHAGAKHLYITIEDGNENLIITYTNDGAPAPGPVSERGGISNLRSILVQYSGELQIFTDPCFTMKTIIPTGEN